MATFDTSDPAENKEDGPDMDEVREMFANFDTDGNGTISADEFQALAYECGMVLSDEESAAIFSGLDADGSGNLDVDEFNAWLNGYEASSDDNEGLAAHAAAALLRAKLGAKWVETKMVRAASGAAGMRVETGGGHKVCQIGADISVGNPDDIRSRVTVRVERPSQLHLDALGEGNNAGAFVILSCKEGVDEFQAGEAAGSLQQIYETVKQMVPPQMQAFGEVTTSSCKTDGGRQGIRISFKSPNNVVAQDLPIDQILPMNPAEALKAIKISLGNGMSFDELKNPTNPDDGIAEAMLRTMHLSINGEFSSEVLGAIGQMTDQMKDSLPMGARSGAELLCQLVGANVSLRLASIYKIVTADENNPKLRGLTEANDKMKVGVLSELATKATGLIFPKLICAAAIKQIGMDKEVVAGIYKNLSETLCGIVEVQALSTVGVMATAAFDNINPFELFLPAYDADLDLGDLEAAAAAESEINQLFRDPFPSREEEEGSDEEYEKP